MSAIAATRHDDRLQMFVVISIILHAALMAFAVLSGYLGHSGENWGGPGGSVTVGLVGNVPALPLPRPEVSSPSRVVDESKGLYKSEPPPKIEPAPDATPLPRFAKEKPPKYITRPSKVLENKTPPPPNAVPYGGGGTPQIPVSSFAIGQGQTQAGMSFAGNGAGDFGSRFAWYVQAVQQRISRSWLQSSIDPSLGSAPRVVVSFTILRNGTITNVQVTRSSNNYSVDNSALRAVRDSSPLNPLPPAYGGSSVNCDFWFDYTR